MGKGVNKGVNKMANSEDMLCSASFLSQQHFLRRIAMFNSFNPLRSKYSFNCMVKKDKYMQKYMLTNGYRQKFKFSRLKT